MMRPFGLLLLVAVPLPALAATLQVEGRLGTAAGGPAADGTYSMAIGLYEKAQGGDALYLEKVLDVEVKSSLFALPLGGLDPKQTIPDDLFTQGKAQWLGVKIAGDPEMARVPLLQVPYAVSATHAVSASGLACSGCVDTADLANAAVTSDKLAQGSVKAQHVEFAYAGSDSKGGAATTALHAKTADVAKNAEVAAAAESAKAADAAKKADIAGLADEAKVAKVAEKLQCTGCVTAAMLGTDVGKALEDQFVLKAGDTVKGALTVAGVLTTAGGADFKSQKLVGFRFENASQPPVKCDASQAGYAYFDPKEKALRLCNGESFQALSFKPAPGQSKDNPAASCLAIISAGANKGDGVYWIDLDGGDPGNAQQLTCDMTGGGWTRVAFDDFEQNANGWNMTTTSTCGGLGKILGGFKVFSGGKMQRTFNLAAAVHKEAKISLDYVSIDSSDGELGYVTVDGPDVWTQTLNNCGKSVTNDFCGNIPPCHGDTLYKVAVTVSHSAGKLELGVGSTLDQGPDDESFGVDNVAVWIK